MRGKINFPKLALTMALSSAVGLVLAGCNRETAARISGAGPLPICVAANGTESIPLRNSLVTAPLSITFEELRSRLNARCDSCHLNSSSGGFQYADSYAPTRDHPGIKDVAEQMLDMINRGKMPPDDTRPDDTKALKKILAAWISAGKPQDKFRASVFESLDPSAALADRLYLPVAMNQTMTNMGSCIPDPHSVAERGDPQEALDNFFANAKELPKQLSETDLVSFDGAELAKRGVFSFVPTYPLWTDDADKLRMVHVPRGQKVTYDPITKHFQIPPNSRFYKTFFKKVVEPDGHVGHRPIETRIIVSRPAINGVDQSLFGTYLWDQTETKAALWDTGYRNNTEFRDYAFTYIDEFQNCKLSSDGKVMKNGDGTVACDAHQHGYAIPGADRCVQCHEGAEGQNFIVGFTPLQINQRPKGEGGVFADVSADLLSQFDRLVGYGVIEDIGGAQNLPRLEDSAGERKPRNRYELEAQAYMLGNCSYCHNVNGWPVRDEPRLAWFNLAPGGVVFRFPLTGDLDVKKPIATIGLPNAGPSGAFGYVVSAPAGGLDLTKPEASYIYRRVSTPVTTVFNWTPDPTKPDEKANMLVPHMPANIPGMDCRAANILGRWMAGIPVNMTDTGNDPRKSLPVDATGPLADKARAEAEARAAAFDAHCTPPPDVINWLDEDSTESSSYVPRRPDWNDLPTKEKPGIPQVIRDLRVDDMTAKVAHSSIPFGYWKWKPDCHFPADLPPNPEDPTERDFYVRPWMVDDQGRPRRPWGEVFLATPGAAVFAKVCSNCHGALADGQSGPAKALYQLSKGAIRVANLSHGLFGPMGDANRPPGSNLGLFDTPRTDGATLGPNGAAKYLVWMASGGTTVQFPAGFEGLLGGGGNSKFGGNMLTKVAYICSLLLPPGQQLPDVQQVLKKDPDYYDGTTLKMPDDQREMWTALCGFRNAIPADDEHARDFDYEKWTRTAQYNGGLMMYFFLRDQVGKGVFPARPDHCEQVLGGSANKNGGH